MVGGYGRDCSEIGTLSLYSISENVSETRKNMFCYIKINRFMIIWRNFVVYKVDVHFLEFKHIIFVES